MSLFNQPLLWDEQLLERYDLAGPRYTSYPTAPQFRDDFAISELIKAIATSNSQQRPLSLYFHIPFCDTLCYYCGCNKVVTTHKSRAAPYLQQLIKELSLQSLMFDRNRPVKQLHWGGGTPTFISDDEMSLLMNATREYFHLLDDDSGEYSIEIHPGRVTANTMHHLRKLGFNRVSMGIQDFDQKVQQAVNRFNSVEEVTALVKALRKQQFHSLSMDLIYGLPLQTTRSLGNTLSQVIDLAPDRISLFNYAHLPHLFKSQRLIKTEELPDARAKLTLLHNAIEQLENAGYIYLGMDHFAKPHDSLVLAQQAGKLQRNFQGYSTHGDCDMLALGVSSISALGDSYVQNAKDLKTYQKKLDAGQLPFVRGFTLNQEDKLRRFVINQLICHCRLDFQAIARKFGINPQAHFAEELAQLAPMADDGLLALDDGGIQVHNQGRLLIRRICMVFDQYLQQSSNSNIQYSKII